MTLKNIKSLRSYDLKESNRLYILELIRRNVCSRAEISSVLGMSRPAVSALVDELIEEGLVLEVGRGQSTETGGKRPILLDLNTSSCLNVAVYFNGVWYELALTDLSANVICYAKGKVNIYSDFRRTFDEIVVEIQEMIKDTRAKGVHQPILACGVSLKGLVDTQHGIMSYTATIPEWRNIPIADYLKTVLKMPVFIENDARANTLAELLLTDGSSQDALTCVTVGVGIGTGVVIQNEIYRGAYDGAVNFAHTTVLDEGPLCSCGNRGCWEALASVTAFLKELGRRNEAFKNITFDIALEKFRKGDPFVREVLLDFTGYWLGVGIANILKVFNPGHLVIQGDITTAGEELRKKITEVAKSRALPVSRNANILFSTLSELVSIKSAAVVVIKHFLSKEFHREIWKKDLLEGSN